MFIDSHCHFNFDCFNQNRSKLNTQLLASGIDKLIVPGTNAKRWFDIIALATEYKSIYFTLGIHPHFLDSFKDDDLTLLKTLLIKVIQEKNIKCVGLGEIGLDKRIKVDLLQQEKVFLAQLEIAQALELPVILHVVKTQSRVLQLLKEVNFSYGGVYHAFSGSKEIAHEFIKLGFKLGIGGVITYPNANKTRIALSLLPLSAFVLETDAPDMPIYQQKTEYNSPLNLIYIFESLCELRKESQKQVEQQLYLNTKSIFSITHD